MCVRVCLCVCEEQKDADTVVVINEQKSNIMRSFVEKWIFVSSTWSDAKKKQLTKAKAYHQIVFGYSMYQINIKKNVEEKGKEKKSDRKK